MIRPLQAQIRQCPPAHELERAWRRLEAAAEASFFQSWDWIGPLLAHFGPASLLAEVRLGGEVAGLALLGLRKGGGGGFWRSPSLHLNETDDPASSVLATEYNGVLAPAGLKRAVECAIWRELAVFGGWREMHLPGLSGGGWAPANMAVREVRRQPAPFFRFGRNPVETALSANCRQQIRRSARLYGGLTVEEARGGAMAVEWFRRMVALHQGYWQGKGQPGAFAAPRVLAFHRQLIGQGRAEILRVAAGGGGEPGYVYAFRHRGWAYAYQSGFAYSPDDSRLKPGLCAHLLAMERYRTQGMTGYRLMAGDARYKQSLSNSADPMVWLVMDRDDAFHRVERGVRRLKAYLERMAS